MARECFGCNFEQTWGGDIVKTLNLCCKFNNLHLTIFDVDLLNVMNVKVGGGMTGTNTNTVSVVDSAVSIMQSVFTPVGENVVAVLNGAKDLSDNDVVKVIQDGTEYFGDAVGALKIIKKIYDLPTMLFMRKFESYCRGLSKIPADKRSSYLENTVAVSRKQESLFVLNILNKIEDEAKIDMTIHLLEAKMDGEIDETTYRRLLVMLGATLHSDLRYMNDHISHDNFSLKDDAQEGLLGHGWIRPIGQGWGTIGESGSENLFAYNRFAKQFCRIVFGNGIEVVPPSDSGIIQMAISQEIDGVIS